MKFEVIPNEQTPKVDQFDVYSIKDNSLLMEFLEYAKSRSDACGLAANQCSIDGKRLNIRVFAIRNLKENTWSLVINPVITDKYVIVEKKIEGCLTWVGKKMIADRHLKIRATYFDMDGNLIENKEFTGVYAQIFQHETDHLNGVPELIVNENTKLKKITYNRNDMCQCGSGKKFKKCCLLTVATL